MTRPHILLRQSALLAVLTCSTALADPLITQSQSSYLTPGLIDMPTAESFGDGMIGAGYVFTDAGNRYGLSFQATPRLTFTLRYSEFPNYFASEFEGTTSLFDRSLDLHYRVWDEKGWRPALAVGLRDFVGTGVYASEYITATKTLRPGLRVTAGLGWGRLGSKGSIGAPFGEREPLDYGNGGSINPDQWFRGDMAPFAGVSWAVNDRLTLKAEYSSDAYLEERSRNDYEYKSPLSIGASYRIGQFTEASAYLNHGANIGFQVSMLFDPGSSPFPSGLEKAPAPVRPRVAPGADPEGWSGHWASDPTAQPAIQKVLSEALAKEGQILESMSLDATQATLRVRNTRFGAEAEALGRTARLMSRALPPSVEQFTIIRTRNGLPLSRTTLSRSALERHENRAAADILPAVTIDDVGGDARQTATPGIYPRLRWAIKPYAQLGVFDPDEPFRADAGIAASARYEITPGIVLDGEIRQKVIGNLDESERGSSGIDGVPVVRTDTIQYYKHGDLTIPRLTASWYAAPRPDLYTRVTAGLLETAFGGIQGEVLWKPTNSRLALGAEIARVKKRDYDQRFSFQDYEVTTGHVSAYYDFGGGILGQLDVGQYLAGDVGATVSLDREFANGWRIGAYVTKTDLSAEEYGEGSFDKGIRLSIPLGWALGNSGRQTFDGTLRSLSRDGGARLDVEGRLYDRVRGGQTGKIYESWGRFWR